MEFAGNKYIYLSKLKKDKVRKIRLSESENKEEAPIPQLDKKSYKMEIEEDNKLNNLNQNEKQKKPDDSDDAYVQVNSNNFNIDLVNSQLNNSMMMNQNAAPGLVFKKAIDTNVCVIRYNSLDQKSDEILPKLYKCEKCESYLNKYSNLIPKENGYQWKCEFCFHLNENVNIDKNNIPKSEVIENCLEPQIVKETNKDDDTSLIFCFDVSGSMCQSYNVDRKLREKFNKIIGKKPPVQRSLFNYGDDDDNIDFSNYDFNQNNTNYISRLDMVKLAIENNINSLLKNSPNVKVGIVSFGNEIEVKGDCLSNVMIVKQKDMNNESKIKILGEENTNLIKSPIQLSSKNIIKSLRATEENGATALGPAVLLSLSLLKNAKIGSRIFLCTDGLSNLGVGDISENREGSIEFYKKVGNIAKEKGVAISLITFEDAESEIDVLKNMVELSGGEIIRVNPSQILDGFNDLLENEVIASEVAIKMNLNKSMTFRDKKDNLKNEQSSIEEKIGNATKETETYYELKFKNATKLADIKEIDYDKLKNLTFQTEITYKNKNGAKYIRIITKNLEVSDNKEQVNKQANLNIVSTNQVQKSAKLAGKGNFMDAQAQIHVARNFLNSNANYSMDNQRIYNQFNSNMNSFHMNLNNNNMMMNSNMMNMNRMNNNMMGGMMNMNNMNRMNNNMMNMNMNNYMMNMNMNNNMMNNNNDNFSGQIFSLAHTSENRQNNMFNRSNI